MKKPPGPEPGVTNLARRPTTKPIRIVQTIRHATGEMLVLKIDLRTIEVSELSG
jgi:hypothetical protein